MSEIFSISGIDIYQKEFSQILIRGNKYDQLNETFSKEISISLPKDNLKLTSNEEFLVGKSSLDQWNLIYFDQKPHEKLTKLVSNLNSNTEFLASDYTFGQIYFDISGDKKNYYLNKLTHFDLRLKKFPINTMAQTLIARIDCGIYHLKDRYIVTCNKSFEDYFKERLIDAINL